MSFDQKLLGLYVAEVIVLITLMFIFEEETSDSSTPSHTEQNDVILEKDFLFFLVHFLKQKCCLRNSYPHFHNSSSNLFSTEVSTVTINTFVVKFVSIVFYCSQLSYPFIIL